ncbi:unnamed protein product, partial [Amoebophrya sp. A120]
EIPRQAEPESVRPAGVLEVAASSSSASSSSCPRAEEDDIKRTPQVKPGPQNQHQQFVLWELLEDCVQCKGTTTSDTVTDSTTALMSSTTSSAPVKEPLSAPSSPDVSITTKTILTTTVPESEAFVYVNGAKVYCPPEQAEWTVVSGCEDGAETNNAREHAGKIQIVLVSLSITAYTPAGRGSAYNKIPQGRGEWVSRELTATLRHRADRQKLKISKDGYVHCGHLLDCYRGFLGMPEIVRCTSTSGASRTKTTKGLEVEQQTSKTQNYVTSTAGTSTNADLTQNKVEDTAPPVVVPLTFEELYWVCVHNDKQRFQLLHREEVVDVLGQENVDEEARPPGEEDDDAPTAAGGRGGEKDQQHAWFVRAVQGHSLPDHMINEEALMTPVFSAFSSEVAPRGAGVENEKNDVVPSSSKNGPPTATSSSTPLLYHGTYLAVIPDILSSGGLSRMSRQHIHFFAKSSSGRDSPDEEDLGFFKMKDEEVKEEADPPHQEAQPPTEKMKPEDSSVASAAAEGHEGRSQIVTKPTSALTSSNTSKMITSTAPTPSTTKTVISGMRDDCDAIICVDFALALKAGLRFFQARNGVFLTPGDAKGFLHAAFFAKIIDRRTGKELESPKFERPPMPKKLDLRDFSSTTSAHQRQRAGVETTTSSNNPSSGFLPYSPESRRKTDELLKRVQLNGA